MATQAQHRFEPAGFSAIRAEDSDEVATLRADLIAVYQPVNSQELHAVERIALAQHSINRSYRIEAGLVTCGLEEALELPAEPRILKNPELTRGITVSRGQNHNYWMAFGFHRMNRLNKDWPLLLRYQAQAERLFRRAIEEFERLRKLREVFPAQDLLEVGPEPEPEPAPQPEPTPETIQPPELLPIPADPEPEPETEAPPPPVAQRKSKPPDRGRHRAEPETPVGLNCDS